MGMTTIHNHKLGLVLGATFGVVHAGWAALVAFKGAQPLLDWMFGLHFIEPVYTVSDFALMNAAMLVVVTALVGYVMGWIFGFIWNKVRA